VFNALEHPVHAELGAPAARHAFYLLDLLAGLLVEGDVSHVDDAVVAGVGAQTLESRVVGLYGVVVILSRWVRMR